MGCSASQLEWTADRMVEWYDVNLGASSSFDDKDTALIGEALYQEQLLQHYEVDVFSFESQASY